MIEQGTRVLETNKTINTRKEKAKLYYDINLNFGFATQKLNKKNI